MANGVRGSTCGKLTMYFTANHKRSLTSRLGQRQVVRGRIVNCAGHSIVRARIDVIHVLKNGKRKLVKTGLRSRDGGKLTLILPLNLKTRDLRFEYRGNLLSTQGHLALDAAHQGAQPPRQARPLGDRESLPRGRRPSREARAALPFRAASRVELEPHARQAVAAVAAPAVGHALEDPPAHAPLGVRRAGPGPGSRTSMCSAPRASTSARSSMRSSAPEVAVLDAVGHELGDDELDLAGPPRRQRQRLDGAPREDDATRRAAAADGSPRGRARRGMQRRRAADLAV